MEFLTGYETVTLILTPLYDFCSIRINNDCVFKVVLNAWHHVSSHIRSDEIIYGLQNQKGLCFIFWGKVLQWVETSPLKRSRRFPFIELCLGVLCSLNMAALVKRKRRELSKRSSDRAQVKIQVHILHSTDGEMQYFS